MSGIGGDGKQVVVLGDDDEEDDVVMVVASSSGLDGSRSGRRKRRLRRQAFRSGRGKLARILSGAAVTVDLTSDDDDETVVRDAATEAATVLPQVPEPSRAVTPPHATRGAAVQTPTPSRPVRRVIESDSGGDGEEDLLLASQSFSLVDGDDLVGVTIGSKGGDSEGGSSGSDLLLGEFSGSVAGRSSGTVSDVELAAIDDEGEGDDDGEDAVPSQEMLNEFDAVARAKEADAMPMAPQPAYLATRLHDHQRKALLWMIRRERPPANSPHLFFEHEPAQDVWINSLTKDVHTKPPQRARGGILADDMGLGKSITVISLIASDVYRGDVRDEEFWHPSLIVAPASLLQNWEDEVEKHGAQGVFTTLRYHGQGRREILTGAGRAKLTRRHIVLTTYGTLASEYNKLRNMILQRGRFPPEAGSRAVYDHVTTQAREEVDLGFRSEFAEQFPLLMTTWRRVVCDEVHILRNSRSARSRAACLLRSKRRWGLSGTPVMNRWSELYALVRYVKLPFVSDPREFKHHLLVPIKRNDPAGYSRLQEIVRYFLLRRTKSILDLPPKEETIEYVTLAGEEQKLYDAVFHKTQLVFQKFLRRGLVLKEYMYFLQQILRLRQIACHPLLATSSEGATRSRRNEDDEETRRARRAARTLWLALKDRSVSSVASLARMQDLARLAVGVCKQLEATMTDCVVCLLPLRREKMEHAFVPKCQHFLCPECMALQRQSGSRHVTCPASGCSEVVDLETVFSVDFESLANAFGEKPIVNASSPAPRQERTMEEKAACKEEVIDSSVYDGGDDREMLRTGLLRYVRNKVFKQHLDVESASGDPFENIRDPETHMLFSSAKVRRLLGLLQEYAAEEAKTVVFSQWTSMLDLISPLLIERGLRFVRLDGSMRLDERTAAIKQFSTGKTDIFLVSLGAGAVGLNLVAATKVVLMDFWWNPFVSEQAIDRVHRLGQTKPVTVVHLAARNTIEVNILELQQQKKDMARGVLCMTSPEELAQRKLNELKLLFSVPGREADAKAKEPAPESSSTSSVASTATAPVAGGVTEPTASWTTATIPAPAEELGVPVAAAPAPTANDLEHYLAAQSEWMARMMDAISSMVMPRE